jgi:hypothetical protein
VDEQVEQLRSEEDDQDERDERSVLTQRELVRASLLRCPPPEPADAPRR